MSNESKSCPKCGAAIPDEAPQGLCPRCLLAVVSVPTEGGATGAGRAVPPPIHELAAAFPQLEILELIGQGGMGVVFKARQPKLDRVVALKILPTALAADAAFAERFTREGRVLARLNHPNIVTVHDFGQANGFFYLLMEFVDGANLRQAMRAGRFTPAQALAVVPKICEALQYAHHQGVLHRDIKPENILLDTSGRVKIADFGIAKLVGEHHGDTTLTASGARLGTPHYMAPEQVETPGDVDHRADIYSLGVVFYEMLTGELPLGRFAPPSEKSTADPRLDEVVFRTLAKDPANRPQSAGEVKTQVENIADTPRLPSPVAGAAAPPTVSPSLKKKTPMWGKVALAAALALLGLVVVGVPFLVYWWAKAAKLVPPPAVEATNSASASAETWKPSLEPGEQRPDLNKIRREAGEFREKGRFEEALQRHIWYHNHALESDAGQTGVRLSFALSEWVELGQRYPKAKQALIEIRDRNTRAFAEGRGYFGLFMDVSSINNYLQESDATYRLFKSLQKTNPALARQCYHVAADVLVENREYALCRGYIGDVAAAFAGLRQNWEWHKKHEERTAQDREEQKKRMEKSLAEMHQRNPALTAPVPFRPPDSPSYGDSSFVKQTRQLVEILVGVGDKAEAEKVRDQAVALLDDPRLKSAVADAEKRVGR